MVEAVHALRTHTFVHHVTVPTFPNGSGAIVYGIEPTRILALEEEFVGNVFHAIIGQRTHEDGCTQETSLQAVVMLFEVLAQTSHHGCFRIAFHQAVLQGKERRSLHGVQYIELEGTVGLQEVFLNVCLGFCGHLLITGCIASGSLGHIGHVGSIQCPIRSAQITPVMNRFRLHAVRTPALATGTFKRLITQPVGILEVSVFCTEGYMVVLGFVHMVHVELHGCPTFIDDLLVAELLPYGPRHDDTGIRPTEAHHFIAILSPRSHARETAYFALAIAHVAHPLVEEGGGIGKEGTCFGKHLGIGRPTEAFVALRTIGRNREVVGELSPIRIGDKLVDRCIASSNASDFHFLGDRCYRNGFDRLDAYFIRSRNRNEAITEEGMGRHISRIILVGTEGIVYQHTRFRNTQVQAMYASFRSVHASFIGTITVVEQFRREASQGSTFLRLEHKRRNRRTVLTEVHHEGFTRLHDHFFTRCKFLGDDDLAEFLFLSTFYPIPNVSLHGSQSNVLTQVDFRSGRREDFA